MTNLLIGAISGNYNISDVSRWIESSEFSDTTRVLLLYNDTNSELKEYLLSKKINLIIPKYDSYNREVNYFETNTGKMTLESSYDLVHNIRFYHIWQYLSENLAEFEKVLITDVRDVYFNTNPFEKIPLDKIIASSEIIRYSNEEWNKRHLFNNLTMIGFETLIYNEVYNVGVFGGSSSTVKDMSRDIYLMSVGKPLVADQTSFNYLIQTIYRDKVLFTNLDNKFAVHLQVVANGLIEFDLNTLHEYSIVHQYDRL